MNRFRLALALGIVAFVSAVGTTVTGWSIGLERETIALAGICLLALSLSAISGRRGSRTLVRPPAPEPRTTVPVPGESLLDAIGAFRTSSIGITASSRRIRDGLQAAAIAALTRLEGHSTESATEQLEAGTWTDDPVAAAYLSASLERPPPDLRTRLRSLAGVESAFGSAVRHTVAAIGAVGSRDDDGASTASLPAYERGPTAGSARSGPSSRARANRTATESVTGTERRATESTAYWTGIGFVALFAVGLGAVVESPAVALAGVVGIGYAGFARSLEPPTLDLSLDRELSDANPEPGDEVTVTVTITNERDAFVPDLRFVDGVPPGLGVTEGSSRLGTALRPGESVTLEYTVAVDHGRHEFDPAFAVVRGLSRSQAHEYFVETDATLVCEPTLQSLSTPVPLRPSATSLAGRVSTDATGAGTTFHSVREYRPSDPLTRIDWNRRAKTGDLATLEFHEDRSARVLVLVDARKAAYRAPDPDATHAVDRSVAAAGRIAATLLETGDAVGLAALGPTDREGNGARDSDPCWLAPSVGRDHEVRLRETLATHPQFATHPPENPCSWRRQLKAIRRRLDARTQVILLSPLCDSSAIDIAQRLEARNYQVTVVSPDPTTDGTVGQQLASVARRVRCVDLRRAGIPVLDWPRDRSIDEALAGQQTGGYR